MQRFLLIGFMGSMNWGLTPTGRSDSVYVWRGGHLRLKALRHARPVCPPAASCRVGGGRSLSCWSIGDADAIA